MRYKATLNEKIDDPVATVREGLEGVRQLVDGANLGDTVNVYAGDLYILQLEFQYGFMEKHIDEDPGRWDYVRLLIAEYEITKWQVCRVIKVDDTIVECAGLDYNDNEDKNK